MERDKIDSLELSSIIYGILRTGSIGVAINIMIKVGKQNAWIGVILGFILGFIPYYLYRYLLNYNKNENIVDLYNKIFGKKLGFIINIISIIVIFFMSCLVFWNVSDFIFSQFLNRTNPIFISIIFVIPVMYILLKGLNIIGRTNLLLFYINILSIVFIVIGLFSSIKIENFQPFLNTGVPSILKATFIYITYDLCPIFLLLIIPKKNIKNSHKLRKRGLTFFCLANLALFIGVGFTIGVLGSDLANLYAYPEYHALEAINLFGYIRKFENILSISWIFSFYMLIVMSLYYVNTSINQMFKIKNIKISNIIIILSSILCMIIAYFLFNNNTTANTYLENIFPYIMFSVLFVIPFIAFIISKFKKTA